MGNFAEKKQKARKKFAEDKQEARKSFTKGKKATRNIFSLVKRVNRLSEDIKAIRKTRYGRAGGGLISDENLSKYMEQGSGALPRGDAALLKKVYKGELDKYMKMNDGGFARKTRMY